MYWQKIDFLSSEIYAVKDGSAFRIFWMLERIALASRLVCGLVELHSKFYDLEERSQ